MNMSELPNPEKEIWNNIDYISPVKRCPKCTKLSLQFDSGEIKCTSCGYKVEMPKVKN
jgi:DNA-directed RNA polymerase subunit RPC12/RpoP